MRGGEKWWEVVEERCWEVVKDGEWWWGGVRGGDEIFYVWWEVIWRCEARWGVVKDGEQKCGVVRGGEAILKGLSSVVLGAATSAPVTPAAQEVATTAGTFRQPFWHSITVQAPSNAPRPPPNTSSTTAAKSSTPFLYFHCLLLPLSACLFLLSLERPSSSHRLGCNS